MLFLVSDQRDQKCLGEQRTEHASFVGMIGNPKVSHVVFAAAAADADVVVAVAAAFFAFKLKTRQPQKNNNSSN